MFQVFAVKVDGQLTGTAAESESRHLLRQTVAVVQSCSVCVMQRQSSSPGSVRLLPVQVYPGLVVTLREAAE